MTTTTLSTTPGERVEAVYPPPVFGQCMPLTAIFDPAHERYLEGAAVRALYETDPGAKRYIDGELRQQRMITSGAEIVRTKLMPGHNNVYVGDPRTMTEALDAVNHILAALDSRPESVTAADPDTVAVRWDARTPVPGVLNLTPARIDQMTHLCGIVRQVLEMTGIRHHIPQLILVASDGAAIELFGRGTGGRTGIRVGNRVAG